MAPVLAQFVTPFEIADNVLGSYAGTAYLRMPRDAKYQPPDPDRPSRGWLVAREANGLELFRADINLFMDGGVGVLVEDAGRLSDALLKSATGMLEPVQAAEVMDAILQRLDAMHSPWASVKWSWQARGVEVFHEDVQGKRTSKKFVVDLRLERRISRDGR